MRALFYLSFGESLGATVLLSGAQAQMVSQMNGMFFRSLKSMIKPSKNACSTLENHIIATISRAANERVDDLKELRYIEVPPLIETMLLKAARTGQHPLEVLFEIRESPGAKEYRDSIAQFRTKVNNHFPIEPDFENEMARLSDHCRLWGQELDPQAGITYVPRRIVPANIGIFRKWLTGLGLEKDFRIKDPILFNRPPLHLVFLSEWYRPQYKEQR